jgi:uncharacterized protein (TIGR00369 family)
METGLNVETDDISMEARRAAILAEGWTEVPAQGYLAYVGPFWERQTLEGVLFGLLVEPKHLNRSGVVHGGMLATLADRSLDRAAKQGAPDQRHVTIELNVQYISPAYPRDFVIARCHPLRQTASVAFVRGTLEAGERLVASLSGIWKIQRSR